MNNRFQEFSEDETYYLEFALAEMLKEYKKIGNIKDRDNEGMKIITNLFEEIGMQNEIIPESLKEKKAKQ